MQMKISNQSGFSLLSVVAVLGIIGLLYVGAQGLSRLSAEGENDLVGATESSQRTVCVMNRQAVSRLLLTWTVTHPDETATIKKLKASGVHVPGCPERGKFSIKGELVECSLH